MIHDSNSHQLHPMQLPKMGIEHDKCHICNEDAKCSQIHMVHNGESNVYENKNIQVWSLRPLLWVISNTLFTTFRE